jgi:pyruvate/2-oxoglutarate dehydrogenase complex dihydrolipoamide dehydrogenase (E3) component
MPDTDIAVIGAGAAGLSVAAIASALGRQVTLFERGAMGGDCLNYGCVPSKALLAAAHAAAAARRAGRLGVRVAGVAVDWPAVRAHVHGAIGHIAPNDSVARFEGMGVAVVQASARFAAPDAIEAAGRRFTFRRAVIAAGSAAIVPALPGLEAVPWLTNETIFDLEAPPAHLLVLGGGPIGLEMAQAHARLGCRVTVLEAAPRVAFRDDPELVAPLRAALLADGVVLREGATVLRVAPAEDGLVAELSDGERLAGSHLLLAVGRAPRLAGLDLAAAGIAATAKGVPVGPDLRSRANRRIWATGDIADVEGLGPRAFTHVASQHAAIIARTLLFRLPAKVDYAALPRVTYTEPELAQVGLTEAEARAAGHRPRLSRWPLAENDRLVAEGETGGLVKLVVAPSGRLLGAGVVGPRAGDMAGLFGLLIGQRLKLSALASLVLPYPTMAEAAKRAASDFYAPKLLSPMVKRLVGLLARLP